MENLSNEDVRLLLNYRKEMNSLIEKQSRSLDFTVVKELVIDLLAQGIEKFDIIKGLTRLTKLVCCYVDTKSLAEDGKVLPKPVSVYGNEHRRRASSQSPTGSGSRVDVGPPSHAISPEQQEIIPINHAVQSQQSYRAVGTCTNTAKRRRVFESEGQQPLIVCSIPIPEDNGSKTQAEGLHFSTDIPILLEQQRNSARPFEEASIIEHRRVDPTSHVATHRDLVPISNAMEVSQLPTKLSVNRANYDKDMTLPSYGLSDLLEYDQTSYCFGEI